jgi:ADP-heptose:LPS heptosyltransferase
MPPAGSQHVLILKPTALGDVAQALLAVPHLKKARPDWHISWVVDEAYVPLVQACPAIDRVVPFPRARWKKKCRWRDLREWSAQLKGLGAGLSLDLQGLARSALMGLASGAGRRVGLASAREGARLTYHELVPDFQEHAVDRYLCAVGHVAGRPAGHGAPAYLPPPEAALPAGLSPGAYTVVHPYSNWASKLWNWGNYDPFFQCLPAERFVLVGQGPFFPVTAANCLDLRGKTDLASLLAVLGRARAVLSTDSGPLHIAAAFNRPLIALFGATDPRKTGPRAQKQILLSGYPSGEATRADTYRREDSGRALAGISVASVAEAWKSLNT